MRPQPLFIAPSSDWTGAQTILAFADQMGLAIVRCEDGTYQSTDGTNHYRTSIVGTGGGWVFAVFADDNREV